MLRVTFSRLCRKRFHGFALTRPLHLRPEETRNRRDPPARLRLAKRNLIGISSFTLNFTLSCSKLLNLTKRNSTRFYFNYIKGEMSTVPLYARKFGNLSLGLFMGIKVFLLTAPCFPIDLNVSLCILII